MVWDVSGTWHGHQSSGHYLIFDLKHRGKDGVIHGLVAYNTNARVNDALGGMDQRPR